MCESHSVASDSLQLHGLYSPWNFPGQNTGVGSHSLLQGIFPTQGSNPGLPHFSRIPYQLSHQGSPRILEWVAYPFSSGSSRPRNWTWVSCTAGGFFTNWATRELKKKKKKNSVVNTLLVWKHKSLVLWLDYSKINLSGSCKTLSLQNCSFLSYML